MWSAVTDPDQLRQWFPSGVEIELWPGGRVAFSGDPHVGSGEGTVTACDPPRHLAFTWGGDELRFDLVAVGDGCRLTLLDLLEHPDSASRNGSGWSICLGELDLLVEGRSVDGPHSAANRARFQPYYDAYLAAGVPHGAAIPD